MATIWITGGRGFIGRNLSKYLHSLGETVLGLGHGAWPKESALAWGMSRWINGEVSASNLNRLCQWSGLPDVVYHLAGGSAVGPSFDHPLEDFSRSVNTTAHLLEWLREEASHVRIIAVSSAAVYGVGHNRPISEEVTPHPFSPYGYHKAIMELLCESYVKNFGLEVVVVRLFSVYGAGLEKQLLWDICRKLASGEKTLTLGGTGEEVRDWLHVSDASRMLGLLRRINVAEKLVINGGTGIGTPIRKLAQTIIDAWNPDIRIAFDGRPRPGDPLSLIADTGRLDALGFKPLIPLGDGAREFVIWFQEHMVR